MINVLKSVPISSLITIPLLLHYSSVIKNNISRYGKDNISRNGKEIEIEILEILYVSQSMVPGTDLQKPL